MPTAVASSYRNVITGILVSALLGVAVVLLLKWSGEGHLNPSLLLAAPPVMGLLMGLVGSIWWWREQERWSLFLIILAEMVVLLLVLIACGAMAFIGSMLTLLAVMSIFIYAGARLGYWMRDSWPDRPDRA